MMEVKLSQAVDELKDIKIKRVGQDAFIHKNKQNLKEDLFQQLRDIKKSKNK